MASPLTFGYPLLIVASGLWFRVRFVWFMTVLALTSYGAHAVDFFARRIHGDLLGVLDDRWDRHVTFAIALLTCGAIVAFLVRRVQVLNASLDQQNP